MTARILDFEVLSFDCYGTLVDWESGIWAALQPLFEANGATVPRSEALASYAELEAAHEEETPGLLYSRLLARVHHDLSSKLGLSTSDDLDRGFGGSVPNWPAFPDSAPALASLQERFRLVILSNVDRESFTASNRRLEVSFDAVYTAEDVGSYKPDPANFDFLIDRVREELGVESDAILHVAQSLYHDHAPAKAAGLATVWIDRQRLSQGGDWGATLEVDEHPDADHVFFSMGEMAAAVDGA